MTKRMRDVLALSPFYRKRKKRLEKLQLESDRCRFEAKDADTRKHSLNYTVMLLFYISYKLILKYYTN